VDAITGSCGVVQISAMLSVSFCARTFFRIEAERGGNLFKTEWLKEYSDLPAVKWRAIYVDTAQKIKERNDYTVFEHWGAGEDGKAALALWVSAKSLDPQAPPQVVTKIETREMAVPATLLTCMPEPEAREVWHSQKQVALYLIRVSEAGEDCRQKLDGVRRLLNQ